MSDAELTGEPVEEPELHVGELRVQSALESSDCRVVLVSKDPALKGIMKTLVVVRCYPDTTDENDKFTVPTFKIEVAAR